MAAMDRLDVEAARSLAQPDFRWLATPSALTSSELSVDDLFRWLQERGRQVSSVRHWIPVLRWLSPNCCVGLGDARAVGLDGEDYEWTRLYVGECRDGLLASVRQFELDDEEAAFAYADTLVAPPPSRLAISNRASELVRRLVAGDAVPRRRRRPSTATRIEFVYDDRRRLSGDPIDDRAGMRAAFERVLEQFTVSRRTRWLSGVSARHSAGVAGRTTPGTRPTGLFVLEIDEDGRTIYRGPLRRGRLRGRLPRARAPLLRRRGRGVRAERPCDGRFHRGDGPARHR